MYEMLHAGFDTLDIAVAGALPPDTIDALSAAREAAAESRDTTLITIGPGDVVMQILGYGARGFAFLADTGPLGANWMISNNKDPRQWNFFVSPKATMLLAYGWRETVNRIFAELENMGAVLTDHSVNRVDFAIDFQTQNFELHLDQFVAHAHTTVKPHWGENESSDTRNQPSAVVRGRQLESVTVGGLPRRQIIVYDKRREAIKKQKYFWFDAWGRDRNDPNLEVWRIEIRAGKRELKDKYKIRTLEDFETSVGDVILNALDEVRYVDDHQTDTNVTRQRNHPLWLATIGVVDDRLLHLQSGLTPDQITEIERGIAIDRYAKLCTGNAIGLGIAQGFSDEDLITRLAEIVTCEIDTQLEHDRDRVEAAVRKARSRLHFLAPRSELS